MTTTRTGASGDRARGLSAFVSMEVPIDKESAYLSPERQRCHPPVQVGWVAGHDAPETYSGMVSVMVVPTSI